MVEVFWYTELLHGAYLKWLPLVVRMAARERSTEQMKQESRKILKHLLLAKLVIFMDWIEKDVSQVDNNPYKLKTELICILK